MKSLCVCAVVGVVSTLAIVVASAVLYPLRGGQATCLSIHHPITTFNRGQTSVEIWQSRSAIATFHWAWTLTAPRTPDPGFKLADDPDPSLESWITKRLIQWWPNPAPWPEPGYQDIRSYIVTRGWPFRCFWHEYDFSNHHAIPRQAGIGVVPPALLGAIELPEVLSIRRPLNRPGTWPIGIPLRPLWAGLALNILSLSVAWWAVIVLPLTLKDILLGALRRRRGLCPACAYDLSVTPPGNPCPECGHKPKHRAFASSA